VDRIGSYEDAIDMAALMGGIEDEPTIVKKRRKRRLLDYILGEGGADLIPVRRERIELKYIIP
jgi:hypothetical protein